MNSTPKTLAEKVWEDHLVVKGENGTPDLIYIDLHLVHEVTSPQAFDGLRQAGRPVRRLDLTIATEDHNTPTLAIDKPIADLTSRTQIQTLRNNAAEFGVRLHSLGDMKSFLDAGTRSWGPGEAEVVTRDAQIDGDVERTVEFVEADYCLAANSPNRLALLTFSTALAEYEDEMLSLFDAVVGTIRLPAPSTAKVS